MSSAGRAPWWYSGDDEQPGAGLPDDDEQPGAGAPLADVTRASDGPEESDRPDGDDVPEGDGVPSSMDWTALVAGAAKMVDWATERVMAPHAEHVDPAEHPDCMVCRTVALIGDPVGLMSGQRAAPEEGDTEEAVEVPSAPPYLATGATSIRWIPILESRD